MHTQSESKQRHIDNQGKIECLSVNFDKSCLINVTSLAKMNAVQLLQSELVSHHIDIALICETWLTDRHSDDHITVEGYCDVRTLAMHYSANYRDMHVFDKALSCLGHGDVEGSLPL